jgi:hypothetical protein
MGLIGKARPVPMVTGQCTIYPDLLLLHDWVSKLPPLRT